jgi:TRAP-type C4-dicarboxylate transport system permease large subunit
MVVVVIMIATVLIMGMLMEQVAIIFVTVPVFMPILQGLDVNLIWFGIMMLIALEVGMMTPPFGLGLFVAKDSMPSVSLPQIIRGVSPFILINVGVIILIGFIPAIATWLPSRM